MKPLGPLAHGASVIATCSLSVMTGLTALLGFAPASVLAGSSSSGRSPKPPFVTEPAGLVPQCNQNTQVGLDGCAYRQLLAADKLLNMDIRVVWVLLGISERSDFVGAQGLWLKYRSADCTSQADLFQGGSIQPMEYTACLAGDDALRREDLKSFYVLLTEGYSSPPRFP